MRIVLILTNHYKNESVCELANAFKAKDARKRFEIIIWEINKYRKLNLDSDRIYLTYNDKKYRFDPDCFSLSQIALVIKRGPVKVLGIFEKLEKYKVPVLNGAQFIKWSSSKNNQYRLLQSKITIPQSFLFDHKFVATVNESNVEKKINAIMETIPLKFPLIFKLSAGDYGLEVYLLESIDALKSLFRKKLTLPDIKTQKVTANKIYKGFCLQEYILTHLNPKIALYYRINLIDGKPQSAVQFQQNWEKMDQETTGINILTDPKTNVNKPVPLSMFDQKSLNLILEHCPCKNGVVGMDIMVANSKIYFLEVNNGPSIKIITDLGRNLAISGTADPIAVKQCENFALAIAQFCLSKLETNSKDAFKIAVKKNNEKVGYKLAAAILIPGLIFLGAKAIRKMTRSNPSQITPQL